jgi:hypothetical protein
MTSKRTIHSIFHKAGLVPVKDVWLKPCQAAQARAWNDENKKAALGGATQEDE